MKYLLDTCVVSELVKPRPSPRVVQWVSDRDEDRLFLSVVTLAELQKGIAKLADEPRRQRLQAWLEKDLIQRFQGRMLEVNEEVAIAWGMIQGAAEAKGVTLPVMDTWVAAIAQVSNLMVVTRNVQDLERCGAMVVNPWG